MKKWVIIKKNIQVTISKTQKYTNIKTTPFITKIKKDLTVFQIFKVKENFLGIIFS